MEVTLALRLVSGDVVQMKCRKHPWRSVKSCVCDWTICSVRPATVACRSAEDEAAECAAPGSGGGGEEAAEFDSRRT